MIMNESFRLALSNRLTYVRMTDTSYYRARDFEDFRGSFNQDDRATENSWDDRIQVDFTWIRDHSLYNYREARAFAYFSLIRLDFVNDALNPANFRLFDFNADLSDWGAGVHYDLSRTFRLNFEITHFFGKKQIHLYRRDECPLCDRVSGSELHTCRLVHKRDLLKPLQYI